MYILLNLTSPNQEFTFIVLPINDEPIIVEIDDMETDEDIELQSVFWKKFKKVPSLDYSYSFEDLLVFCAEGAIV